MGYGLDAPVLVLNRHYQPVRVTRARRAITLLYVGAAQALDATYELHDFESWTSLPDSDDAEVIGTTSGGLRVPRLLLLMRYGRTPATTLRLSRRNVYLRDDFTCQYCARRLATKELNLDHVTPRCKGGRASWDNLVTSCRRCNFRKGSDSPEAAGMTLLKPPTRPTWTTAVALAAAPRRFAEWEPFLPQIAQVQARSA